MPSNREMPEDCELGAHVTIADVARAAGLGTSTVSRALSGRGSVKPATRVKVLEAARELGYVPNPAVASLVSLRSRKHQKRGEGSGQDDSGGRLLPVAVLTRLNLGRESPGSSVVELNEFGRARGLRFEVFNTLEPEFSSAKKLGNMLYNRGFAGVVLQYIIRDPTWFEGFPWHHFAVISLDAAFKLVPVTIVRSSQFEDVLLCWEKLREKGYRRIGAILPGRQDGRVENLRRLGAWQECQGMCPPEERIPAFTHDVLDVTSLDGVPRWVAEHRPDALLATLSSALDYVLPRLETPPRAAAMNGGGGRYPGLRRNRGVQIEAVRVLDQLIRSASYGLPPRTVNYVIPAEWVEAGGAPGGF